MAAEFIYYLEFVGVGTGDAGFGGAVVAGGVGQEGRQGPIGMGEDAEQAAGGVEGVVVAVVPGKAAGHFAGEDGMIRARGLDEGMAGAVNSGRPPRRCISSTSLGAFTPPGGGTGVLRQDQRQKRIMS